MVAAGIAELVATIKGDKQKFLEQLRGQIEATVVSKSPKECLSVTTTSQGGAVVNWDISDGVPYFQRFLAFLRNKDYGSYKVDSGLTAPVLSTVSNAFAGLLNAHSEQLSNVVLVNIMTNDDTREEFLTIFLRDNAISRVAGAQAKHLVGTLLLHGLQEKCHHIGGELSSHVAHKAALLTTKLVSTGVLAKAGVVAAKIAASAAGKVLLTKLSLLLAKSLGPILIKLMAKPAVAILLKKFIAVAVLGSLMKIVAAKFGAAAISFVLIPVLAYWLYKDYQGLPKKLGASIASSLCTELGGNFDRSVQDIVVELVVGFTETQVLHSLANALADDADVARELGIAMAAMA